MRVSVKRASSGLCDRAKAKWALTENRSNEKKSTDNEQLTNGLFKAFEQFD